LLGRLALDTKAFMMTKRVFRWLTGLTGALLLSPGCFAVDQDEFDAAAVAADKIVKQELMTNYQGEKGLLVKPGDIDPEENPKLKALDEKFPTLWKRISQSIAENYVATFKPFNDANSSNAAKMRPHLTDAFMKTMKLRGGGSASASLGVYLPAQVEWMIGNVGRKQREPMADEAFVSRLAQAIIVGYPGNESKLRNELKPVLKAIKQAEALLNRNQVGFVRAEFLAYFAG
jgi:hypothetical protein